MCKAKEKEEPPPCLYTEETARGDYNARLGYGTDQVTSLGLGVGLRESTPTLTAPYPTTDQGRWLVEQAWHRRRQRLGVGPAASWLGPVLLGSVEPCSAFFPGSTFPGSSFMGC